MVVTPASGDGYSTIGFDSGTVSGDDGKADGIRNLLWH